jgi:hypothetical protein
MAKILENENYKNRKKVEAIDTDQLEYTATTMFTYGTILVAVVSIYASTAYLFVKQLRKD